MTERSQRGAIHALQARLENLSNEPAVSPLRIDMGAGFSDTAERMEAPSVTSIVFPNIPGQGIGSASTPQVLNAGCQIGAFAAAQNLVGDGDYIELSPAQIYVVSFDGTNRMLVTGVYIHLTVDSFVSLTLPSVTVVGSDLTADDSSGSTVITSAAGGLYHVGINFSAAYHS